MSGPVHLTLPAQVYVPTTGDGPAATRTVALARDLSGAAELFCFSSPERLRQFHGTATPWRQLTRAETEELARASGVVRCHLDPVAVRAAAADLPAQRPAAARRTG